MEFFYQIHMMFLAHKKNLIEKDLIDIKKREIYELPLGCEWNFKNFEIC